MKILYIHQYFKTPEEGGAIRSYYLASALARLGHEVHLITSSNKHIGKTLIEGINVYYLPVPYDNKFNFARRLWAFSKFMTLAYFTALKIKGAEICYATSTPLSVGFLALVLKKFNSIPYYFEVRDLWPSAPIEMGYIKNPLLKHLLRKLEYKIYRNAHKIVSLSPGIAEHIKSLANINTDLIPNISDCDFFEPSTHDKKDNKLTIAYIGSIGKANDLLTLVTIAKRCQDAGISDVNFVIAGDGAEKDFILSEIKREKLSNIVYRGNLDKSEVKNLLADCDAVYVSFADYQILSTCSPNKFFDGLAAGKLVISNYKGWITDLIIKHNCGLYVDRNTPEAFIDSVMPVLRSSEIRANMGENARQLAKSRFDRPLLEQKFVKLFEN